jgi:hypothetical protein
MRRDLFRLRTLALLGVGSLVIHELRYALGPVEHGGAGSGAEVHGYLAAVWIVVGVLLVGALALFGRQLLRARASGEGGVRAASFSRRWLWAAGFLFTLHALQETVEVQVAAGGPVAEHGLAGGGGLLVVVLAVVLGAAIAALLGGADRAVALVAAAAARHARPSRPVRTRRARRPAPETGPLDVLARHLAGRAPPALSS